MEAVAAAALWLGDECVRGVVRWVRWVMGNGTAK